MEADYRTALLCNAYSTNQDYFSRPMAALVETILGTIHNVQTLWSHLLIFLVNFKVAILSGHHHCQ